MTQSDKELLLKDLCARLPYGVKIGLIGAHKKLFGEPIVLDVEDYKNSNPLILINSNWLSYLRPMSSMTEKEKRAFEKFMCIDEDAWLEKENGYFNQAKIISGGIDWLNAHHFDSRGLLPMGLAIEAPEGMYKNS